MIAKRLAANQPQRKKEELPKRKKPRALVVPPQCEAEDGLIMRNIVRLPLSVCVCVRVRACMCGCSDHAQSN